MHDNQNIYYVATVYKFHDILLRSENGKDFYFLADKITYSDLGISPTYHYTAARLKDIEPATREDFKFFRVAIPKAMAEKIN